MWVYQTGYTGVPGLDLSICVHCKNYSIWLHELMLFPKATTAPLPHLDIPEAIVADYEEARSILATSPRGAAALLRLAIQKLCINLGQAGKNINEDIKALVLEGLPVKVQQALDVVRVVGNNAVHPGQLDLKDKPETSENLFHLINLIVEVMIAQPRHIDEMYNAVVPPNLKAAIEIRDRK